MTELSDRERQLWDQLDAMEFGEACNRIRLGRYDGTRKQWAEAWLASRQDRRTEQSAEEKLVLARSEAAAAWVSAKAARRATWASFAALVVSIAALLVAVFKSPAGG